MFHYFFVTLKDAQGMAMKDSHAFFNLFQYITFRAALSAVTAFLSCVLFGDRFIAWLTLRKIGEKATKTDSERLSILHRSKEDTPTMGGVFMMGSVLIALLLWADLTNPYVLVNICVMLGLSVLGWIDDYQKLTVDHSKGLSIRHKLAGQVLVCAVCGYWIYILFQENAFGTHLQFPFFKNVHPNLGRLFPVFAVMVMVSASNAVNLTDGLDGLATGCYLISAFAYLLISYVVGRVDYSHYLYLIYVPGSGELTVVCASLLGAGLGFLWFNCHPAQVFMGDSGALPLGGVLGCIAIMVKHELLLFLVGGIFVAEAFSVALQVLSFRFTGKRIFRIAPVHHHFQFLGWKENKVVVRFWILAVILAVLSMSTLKLR